MATLQVDRADLEPLYSAWLRQDQDPETREELNKLVVQEDYAELHKRLATRISFGTAGLRAKMEAGYSRMNSLTVIQASQGLAKYVLEHVDNAAPRGIVIGRDARRNSEKFAKYARAAFEAAGFTVYSSAIPVHTPLVPFSIKHYNAAAGIMITASHNPKDDNGYKVYWENGAQINTPRDKEIAETILQNLEPWPGVWDAPEIDTSEDVEEPALAHQAYFSKLQRLLYEYQPQRDLKLEPFMYTPLHGVGSTYLKGALNKAFGQTGAKTLEVPNQADPDPDFPTVKFPNPEEEGALDHAYIEADKHDIDLVIANDPDADRFSAAEKDPTTGEWTRFTGNEVGILLAQFLSECAPIKNAEQKHQIVLMNTVVSTKLLEALAMKNGFKYHQTLTGFKWMGNEAQRLEAEGFNVPFAFEEALGYMFPRVVYDKDGIAAAMMFLAAFSKWKKEEPKITLRERYLRICQEYGYYVDANSYLIRDDPEVTNRIFDDIRTMDEGSRPKKLMSRDIIRWVDLTKGYDSSTDNSKPELPIDSSTQMIMMTLKAPQKDAGESYVTIRGSGTEPKIKMYVEAMSLKDFAQATKTATAIREDIIEFWMDPKKYNLKRPGEP